MQLFKGQNKDGGPKELDIVYSWAIIKFMKETVCLVSLGCPKNLVDSEVILGLLSKAGHPLTTDPEKGEIIIVNTCSFIKDATQEAIETILKLTPYKREGRCRLLVVAGCLPQRYGRILEKELPEVDLFVGTGTFQKIPDLLSQTGKKKSHLLRPSFLYNDKTPRILSTPPFSAYLKIAEGCSRTCTFCTVPQIRGPYRSRTIHSICQEAERLAEQGVKELTLIAQDTTAYGKDLGERVSLEALLTRLVRIDGLRWIRVLYAYPRSAHFSEGLLKLIKEEKKICSYLDLPIQHIDDDILRRMGRRTKGQEIRDLLYRIRTAIPEVVLRTSLIVGFPGEKESQFKTLLRFVEEVQFDHLGAFKYSPEERTPAFRFPHRVSEELKEERFQTLMEVQKKISFQKYRRMIGQKREVLVEGADHQTTFLRGRLQTQAPEIDGMVFLKGQARAGDWVEAQITQALPYDLVGEIEKILV